jgi:hypothetical protein
LKHKSRKLFLSKQKREKSLYNKNKNALVFDTKK